MDPPVSSDTLHADGTAEQTALRLLSHETRSAILRTLWEATDPRDPAPVPFSELRDRLDVDDPGRLNYHLNELRVTFLRRTDAGYELTESGKRIVRVLLSGTAITDPAIDRTPVDMDCWYCSGDTTLRYEDGWRYLECTQCDARCVESFPPGVISKTEYPPAGLLDRTPNEINDADRTWITHRRASVMDGVCPECAGDMPVDDIQICDDHQPDWNTYQYCEHCGSIFQMLVSHVCETCKYHWRLPTRFYPTRHPAVTAFYYDHGIELDLATHEQRTHLLDFDQTRASKNPLRIQIAIELDDDRLQLTYDDQMTVVDVTRHQTDN